MSIKPNLELADEVMDAARASGYERSTDDIIRERWPVKADRSGVSASHMRTQREVREGVRILTAQQNSPEARMVRWDTIAENRHHCR